MADRQHRPSHHPTPPNPSHTHTMTSEHVPKGFEKYLHVPVGAQQPHARWFAMYAAGGPTPEALLGDLAKTCVYRTVTNEAGLEVNQVLISLKNKLRIANIRAAVPGLTLHYVKPYVDWADFLTFMQNKHAPGLVEGSIHATIHQKASPHSSPDMWEPDCATPKKRKTEHALACDGEVESEAPVPTPVPAPVPTPVPAPAPAQGEGKDLYDWVCHFSLTQGRRPFKDEYIKRFINLLVLFGAAPFERSLEAMNIKNM